MKKAIVIAFCIALGLVVFSSANGASVLGGAEASQVIGGVACPCKIGSTASCEGTEGCSSSRSVCPNNSSTDNQCYAGLGAACGGEPLGGCPGNAACLAT